MAGQEQSAAFRVLIVDTTNTARAAVGERLLRHHLALRGIPSSAIRVTSAGLEARDGEPMQDLARREIERFGGSARGFAARSLSDAVVAGTHLFVCGTPDERDELTRRHPQALGRSFSLSEIAQFYRHLSIGGSPLHEHPRILDHLRAEQPHTPDWDLPPWEALDERVAAVGRHIDQACAWIADIWSATAPGRAPLAPEGPDGEDAACTVDAFGVTVRVRCTGERSAALARSGHAIWARCLREQASADAAVDVYVGSDPDALAQARSRGALAHGDVESALHHLTSAVTVRAIEQRVGSLVMLHAAAVASPGGDVVGFVAPSGTGKTTLARTLGAHYGYVTDETLAIDTGRTVLPYPKPLSLIEEDMGVKGQWGPDSLDLMRAPAGRLRLVRLALLDRDPRWDGPAQVEEVRHLEGIAALASQVSYLARLPRQLHTLSDLVDSVGGVVRVRYREARDILTLMPVLLEGGR